MQGVAKAGACCRCLGFLLFCLQWLILLQIIPFPLLILFPPMGRDRLGVSSEVVTREGRSGWALAEFTCCTSCCPLVLQPHTKPPQNPPAPWDWDFKQLLSSSALCLSGVGWLHESCLPGVGRPGLQEFQMLRVRRLVTLCN